MSTFVSLALPSLAAALLAFGLTPLVSRFAVLIGAIDMPGDRKIHDRPVPRLGGLAVVTAICIVWLAELTVDRWSLPSELMTGLGFGVLPLLAISVIDDIRSVKAGPKCLVHVLSASIAVACGVSLESDVHLLGFTIHIGLLAPALSVLWIVGVTNAFNIIDGLDGLSAGLALIGAVSMAAVFVVVEQPGMAAAALVLAGGPAR